MNQHDAAALAQSLMMPQGGVGGLVVQPQMVGAALNVQPQFMRPTAIGAQVQYDASAQNFARPIQVSPEAYVDGGLTYLGFGATTVNAGVVQQNIPIATQRPFTPQHLRLPSTVIGLLINAVLLEGTNLYANQLGVPIELFSEVATAPQMPWPTLDTSTGIVFVVSNPTAGNLVFSGAFYGTQVRR